MHCYFLRAREVRNRVHGFPHDPRVRESHRSSCTKEARPARAVFGFIDFFAPEDTPAEWSPLV